MKCLKKQPQGIKGIFRVSSVGSCEEERARI